jgi:hypothetical protein
MTYPSAIVPIVITNSQAVGTGTYQQIIHFNSAQYSSYLNSNWTNVRFVYGNDTKIPAWIESNASNTSPNTVVWLRLYPIGPSSSETVYLFIDPTGTFELSASGPTGEAPYLSAQYGRFDDGRIVFNFYDNFAGTTLSSEWGSPINDGGTATVNNGIVFTVDSTDYVFLATAAKVQYPLIAEMDFDPNKLANTAANPMIGESETTTTTGAVDLCGGYEYNWYAGSPNQAFMVASNQPVCNTNTVSSGQYSPDSGSIVGFVWYSTGSVHMLVNYASLYNSGDNSVAIGNYYLYFGISNSGAGSFGAPWFRARAYPPSGVMPTASTGTANPVYQVTFATSGLPAGTGWHLNFTAYPAVIPPPDVSTPASSSVVPLINGTYSFRVTSSNSVYAYTGTGGVVESGGTPSTVPVPFSQVIYPIGINETGLPAGSTWYVNLTGGPAGFTLPPNASALSGGVVLLHAINGTYTFATATNNNSFYATHPINMFAESGGTPKNVTVTFAPKPTYAVTFNESGLPAGTPWSVTVGNGSSGSSSLTISWILMNGTYQFQVGLVPGYLASPLNGSFRVNGAPLNISIDFTHFVNVSYPFDFVEKGLPTGAEWYVNFTGGPAGSSLPTNLSGAAKSALPTRLINGTYTYDLATNNKSYSTPTLGSLIEAGGSPANVTAIFTEILYSVTFTESGLPSGTSWSLTFAGTQHSVTTSSTSTQMPNGTYGFSVGVISGYQSSPSTGTIHVDGKAAQQAITFSKIVVSTYVVAFDESGLPAGTFWSVSLGGTLLNYSATQITFNELNGSYSYNVSQSQGYLPNPAHGVVSVAGSPVTVQITFTKKAKPGPEVYLLTFKESGLPNGDNWSVTVGSTEKTANSTLITFSEANGTYYYNVTGPGGYTITNDSGTVKIQGSPQAIAINFEPQEQSTLINGVSTSYFWLLVIAAIAVIALLCAVLIYRRRRRDKKTTPAGVTVSSAGVTPTDKEAAEGADVPAPAAGKKEEWRED